MGEWMFENINVELKDTNPTLLLLDPNCCTFLMKEALKHLLYIRQQIPCTFSELEANAMEIQEKKMQKSRISIKQNKALNAYKNTLELFQTCDTIFSTILDYCHVNKLNAISVYLCLVIGSSANAGSEFFIFRFYVDTQVSTLYPQSKLINLSRQVIRHFITCSAPVLTKNCNVKKTHLLCFMPREITEIANENFCQLITPKQQLSLKIRLPKPKQKVLLENKSALENILVIHIGSSIHAPFNSTETFQLIQNKLLCITPPIFTSGQGSSASSNQVSDMSKSDWIWFTAKSFVTGYKIASDSSSNDLFM
jgi:hypothetical protein